MALNSIIVNTEINQHQVTKPYSLYMINILINIRGGGGGNFRNIELNEELLSANLQ